MSKEEVADLYINKNMTISEVAAELKINRTVLMSFMAKNNISKDDKKEIENHRKQKGFKQVFNSSEIRINEW